MQFKRLRCINDECTFIKRKHNVPTHDGIALDTHFYPWKKKTSFSAGMLELIQLFDTLILIISSQRSANHLNCGMHAAINSLILKPN